MKSNKKKKKALRPIAQYKTYALADDSKHNDIINAAVPSEESVKSAKDWVDYNKL